MVSIYNFLKRSILGAKGRVQIRRFASPALQDDREALFRNTRASGLRDEGGPLNYSLLGVFVIFTL